MNNLSLAAIFLVIAIAVVGAAVAGFAVGRGRYGENSEDQEPSAFPALAAEVLELFGSVGILLGQGNQVIRMNNRAESFGLVSAGLLAHPELIEISAKARQSGKVEIFEGTLRVGLQQNKVQVLAKASLVGEKYVVLVLEDRTKDLKLDRIRRDFIGNISHELKTPIGAISLLSEAISQADDKETIDRFAANLNQEAKRLAQLVQDVIELSRLQSTEVLAEAELVDIAAVVEEAIERNGFLAKSKQVRILSQPGEGIKVFGNKEMLTMALRNLIENAVLYSESGSQVGVGCSNIDGVAEIAITDSGVGISPENQERIFERFYRVDPSRSRETGGTGLGLSIVKHVAKIHRGEIKLFSQIGVGSTFTFRIPAAKDSDPKTGTLSIVSEEE